MMSLFDRILGNPWVYEYVRPLAAGGLDYAHAYRRLRCGPSAHVLDLGCGTGDALRYLDTYEAYLGIDTDERAIRYAASRWQGRAGTRFECRLCTPDDVRAFAPTHAALIGLLHHLDDGDAVSMLKMLRESPRLERAVTLDTVYLRRHPYNNLLTRLDRGRFGRSEPAYVALAERAGLRVVEHYIVKSHPTRGLVKFCVLVLEP